MMTLEVFEFWLKTKINCCLEMQSNCKNDEDQRAIGYDLAGYRSALTRFQQFKIEYEERNKK